MTNKRSSRSLLVVALAASVAVILVFARSLAMELVYPIERGAVALAKTVGGGLSGMFGGAATKLENASLRVEAERAAVLEGEVRRLERENDDLRKALGYVNKARGSWVSSSVISESGPAVGLRKSLRIGRGSLDGIRENAVVVSSGGLVGRVVEVTLHTATVALITDPAVAVACEVEGVLGVRGVLSGGNEGALALRYATNARDIAQGARVLTSGRGGLFPKGIPVGTVAAVEQSESSVFPRIVVSAYVDFDSLENVFVRREE